ncbi:MAG: T9SS type A sorting domain-containing protein [Bacteroidota bacterium]
MKTKTICSVILVLQMIVQPGISGNVKPLSSPHNPENFLLSIQNIFQTADNVLQFDIYLLDTDMDEPMELATIQFGICFNTQILNGAAQTSGMTSIIPGSSELPEAMQPVSVNSSTGGLIRVAGRAAPGSGNGFIVPASSPGVRIVSLRMVNQLPFTTGITPDLVFTPSTAITPSYATRVAIYLNGLNTQLPVIPGINAIVTGNPVLGQGNDLLPFPFMVTGGGDYCQGDQGMPVGLEYSQSGVVYELFRDGLTTNLTLIGTGTPLSFGLQPDGVYTITGTNENGTTQMAGSTTIAEAPLPVVTISADQDTYCHGSNATFTADLDFSGEVTYQWFRNNAPVGTNSATLTLWAVDGDNIWLRVTSEQGCAAVSNTLNLEVFINYASVYFDINEPIQLVAGEEITLAPYTYNAGLEPTFEWFVNDVQVPVNNCELTYTPGPADEVYVRMIPSLEVPCLSDVYYSNTVVIYTCTGPPLAFDVWGETNTCGGEFFSFGLSDTEIGVKYYLLMEFDGLFYHTPYEFFGSGNAVEEYGFQGGDYYYLAVNACDSTWMNGHADLYPFDTRATVSVSDNNICSGEEVVFNAKSNQPESVICTYNWVINGNWEWNPKPDDFIYTPVNGDVITVLMATPCQHDDLHFPDNNRILMMVNDCPGISTTWIGNNSENWHDQNNWDNGVPGTNTIAIIPGGRPNYPTITSIARCKSIIIEHGGSFIGGEFLEQQSALVKCNISDEEFHFLSSPVNPNPIFGEVFPTNQNTIWARKYKERYGEWINLTKFDQFEKAKGYSMQLTLPNTAHFIGLLNGTNSSTHIENYNTSGLADWAGWNLLGNPFPSAIDWDLIPHNFIENAVYVWNGTQYISWNGIVGALENGIIPPMNGFFVKMTASYWKDFTIPAIARVHGNVPFYREIPAQLIEMTVSGEDYTDKTFIHFNQDATAAFDPEFDARKLRGIEQAPQLFSYAEGKELSINEQPFMAGTEIELGFKCSNPGIFSLNAKGLESFGKTTHILLCDLRENLVHDLMKNPQYKFNYIKGEDEHRFRLKFTEMPASQETSLFSIYSFDKTITINNYSGLPGEVSVFDLTGRDIMNTGFDSGNISSFTLNIATGTYLVKVATSEGILTQKVFIR